MKKLLLITSLYLLSLCSNAQQQYDSNGVPIPYGPQPEVGKPMTDFTLDNITHYKTKKASLTDFKGKWLFLDFWFTGCIACIKAMPKVSALQQQFKDDVQFVLVGENDTKHNKGIETLYEKLRIKHDLRLASAYDSVLVNKWGISSMPYVIIINPAGIVQAITNGSVMEAEKIADLIAGKEVKFSPRSRSEMPLFTPANGTGTKRNMVYQSLLTKWNGEEQRMRDRIEHEIKYLKDSTGMNFSAVPLEWLYKWAYLGLVYLDSPRDSLYGQVYPAPVLEIEDSTPFQYDYTKTEDSGIYNYSLLAPPSKVSVPYVMNIMQNDLQNAFGYEVVIENRMMPVWNLMVISGAAKKLTTKGGETYFKSHDGSATITGFTLKNVPMQRLLNTITWSIYANQPPYFDATGITDNIDITIDALLTDREEIRKALQKNGLDLALGEKEFQVIVIRDPKPEDGHMADPLMYRGNN